MQGFFAQISQSLATDAAVALMEDGTQLVCLAVLFLLGKLTVPLILRTCESKSCLAAKVLDDEPVEDSKASADGQAGLALLLEHYGVLDAPLGTWSSHDETTGMWPSVDEVCDYFQAALSNEDSATAYSHVPDKSVDPLSGLALLEHYGVFGALCGSWSGRDEISESEPSLDEVSDYFQAALEDERAAAH